MKKYIAKTNVSVNVVLANGKSHHVSFSPLTGRGSVFYTDIPELQVALEAHYKYGRLFKRDPSYPEEKPRAKKPAKESRVESGESRESETIAEEVEEVTEETEEVVEAEEEGESNVIVVTDPDEAKDYLCEHYGLSRTKIKGLNAIKEAAAQQGITFKGLD